MSLEHVKEYLKKYRMEDKILILKESSATVELAAKALHTKPERIAKTLSFWLKDHDHAIVIVCAGDCRIDNHAYKEQFHEKAKMLNSDEVLTYTSHEVGGVCPFAIPDNTKIYLDVSLKRFPYVYPACGSANSAIKLSIKQLEEITPYCAWIDVCKFQKKTSTSGSPAL